MLFGPSDLVKARISPLAALRIFLINLVQNLRGLLNRFTDKPLHIELAPHVHRVVVVDDFDNLSCGQNRCSKQDGVLSFSGNGGLRKDLR